METLSAEQPEESSHSGVSENAELIKFTNSLPCKNRYFAEGKAVLAMSSRKYFSRKY